MSKLKFGLQRDESETSALSGSPEFISQKLRPSSGPEIHRTEDEKVHEISKRTRKRKKEQSLTAASELQRSSELSFQSKEDKESGSESKQKDAPFSDSHLQEETARYIATAVAFNDNSTDSVVGGLGQNCAMGQCDTQGLIANKREEAKNKRSSSKDISHTASPDTLFQNIKGKGFGIQADRSFSQNESQTSKKKRKKKKKGKKIGNSDSRTLKKTDTDKFIKDSGREISQELEEVDLNRSSDCTTSTQSDSSLKRLSVEVSREMNINETAKSIEKEIVCTTLTTENKIGSGRNLVNSDVNKQAFGDQGREFSFEKEEGDSSQVKLQDVQSSNGVTIHMAEEKKLQKSSKGAREQTTGQSLTLVSELRRSSKLSFPRKEGTDESKKKDAPSSNSDMQEETAKCIDRATAFNKNSTGIQSEEVDSVVGGLGESCSMQLQQRDTQGFANKREETTCDTASPHTLSQNIKGRGSENQVDRSYSQNESQTSKRKKKKKKKKVGNNKTETPKKADELATKGDCQEVSQELKGGFHHVVDQKQSVDCATSTETNTSLNRLKGVVSPALNSDTTKPDAAKETNYTNSLKLTLCGAAVNETGRNVVDSTVNRTSFYDQEEQGIAVTGEASAGTWFTVKRKRAHQIKNEDRDQFLETHNEVPKRKDVAEGLTKHLKCKESGEQIGKEPSVGGREEMDEHNTVISKRYTKENPKNGNRILQNSPKEETQAVSSSLDDFHTFANQVPSDSYDQEQKNYLKIVSLLYGVALPALRRLFRKVHPTWSNQPTDAAALERGKMKLKSYEEQIFKSGDITKWDFSLITSVLMFSKECYKEITKVPKYQEALRSLKDNRNQLVGHPKSEKLTNADFQNNWEVISKSLKVIGVTEEEINKVETDDTYLDALQYRQQFLDELASNTRTEKLLGELFSKVDQLVVSQQPDAVANAHGTNPKIQAPRWDEWLNFSQAVRYLDGKESHYILLTDKLPEEDTKHLSVLRSVPWKIVVDFDPLSEEEGMYRQFISHEGQSNLVQLLTPGLLKQDTTSALIKRVSDVHKKVWVFIKEEESARMKDRQMAFREWKLLVAKQISRLFGCCSDPDKLDRQKPIICLILPFRQESKSFLELTLERLIENFSEYQLDLVAVTFDHDQPMPENVRVREFNLPTKTIELGVSEIFNVSAGKQYKMPTSQANVPVQLKENEYLYLKEYLEILYDGCEELPTDSTKEGEEKVAELINEHRKVFMSGNWISHVSLFDNHDAKREIENKIRTHLQQMLDYGMTHPAIVEIRHSPGTGGSTIARRVLWDLHKSFPCAIASLSNHRDLDEDADFTNSLTERIADLEDICSVPPVILLDGRHWRIWSLSNKLVRLLNNTGKRAILVRCQHGAKDQMKAKQMQSEPHRHVFCVNAKLEESRADLNEFHQKYKEFIQLSKSKKSNSPCRVFHFPLLAMLEEFRPKLKEIVDNTFNEMQTLQQEIAIVVAFMQIYADQPTPALLLYHAFKEYLPTAKNKASVTYEDIKDLFSDHLLNLMVQEKPSSLHNTENFEDVKAQERYTLQHWAVAEQVLKKVYREQDRTLCTITEQFLSFPLYQQEQFLPILLDLFLYNKGGERHIKNSILVEELVQLNPDRASEILCSVAAKTDDPTIFAHVARFHAEKNPPSFPKAKDLISNAFKANNAESKSRVIFHNKGVVLYCELKHKIRVGEVQKIEELQELAHEAIQSYFKARNFPPTWPYPLLGEVKVWLACIEWITKNQCKDDSDEALKYITSRGPPFFRTCVSDSFYLLDIVDNIMQTAAGLRDPDETQMLANKARLSLMQAFKSRRRFSTSRDADDVVKACQALCSSMNFPRSSQTELKQLQAHYMLSLHHEQNDKLKLKDLTYLLKLLEELVFKENQYHLCYHLMKVSVYVNRNSFSLERALNVTDKWLEITHHDPLPHFYAMMIYFMKILDGFPLQYFALYHKALKACQEKSQNHCRATMSTYYIGKDGQGMSRLVTRSALELKNEYEADDFEKAQKYWKVDSRKKLFECRGRIRVRSSSSRGREQPYIELVQGNLELHVGKSADVGKAGKDFTPGSIVYFVVSFNFKNPVANGITFEPASTLNPRGRKEKY